MRRRSPCPRAPGATAAPLVAAAALGGVLALLPPALHAQSTPAGARPASAAAAAPATARPAARGAWQPLFDGRTTAGWRGYRSTGVPKGWEVVDGVLTKSAPTGDLISEAQYGDFELAFDWRLARGGNAGVFYRVTEAYDHPYWTGPEYQLLDDAHAADGRSRLTAAAAAYGLYGAPAGVVRPAGEWNSGRIVVRGNRVEHWLNGRRVVAYVLGSPAWEARVKASKFGEWPQYGRAARGHIAIQGDHDGLLALRNVRIREL